MTWDSAMPILVRNAIGDFDTTSPKYSDDQLATVILTAAQGVIFSISPTQNYSIDIENITLIPDPTDPTINDNSFVYLVTLKSSAMLLYTEVRLFGQQAIAIRDGTSAIDLKRDLKTLTELADTYTKEYQKGIANYYTNNGVVANRAIVSPYPRLLHSLDGYFYGSRSYRY